MVEYQHTITLVDDEGADYSIDGGPFYIVLDVATKERYTKTGAFKISRKKQTSIRMDFQSGKKTVITVTPENFDVLSDVLKILDGLIQVENKDFYAWLFEDENPRTFTVQR